MDISVRIVCPESCAYEGNVGFVTLPSTDGEMGVLSGHANEICTLTSGYIRLSSAPNAPLDKVIAVDSGYAEITDEKVIILASRAQDLDAVSEEEISAGIEDATKRLEGLSEDDARRAHILNELAWCKLLGDYKPR